MSAPESSEAGHVRLTGSLLGRPERAFVRWFCARVSDRVTPDHLTAIGMVGSLMVFAGYVLSHRAPAFLWLASFGLLVNWFGDTTDGNLARYRHTERPRYGFFLDHAMDSLSMLLVFLGLGLSPYLRLDIALLGLVAYLLMSIFVYLDTIVNKTFQISFGWFGPTEGRALIVLVNVLMGAIGRPRWTTPWGAVYLYDLVVGVGAAALFTTFLLMVAGRLRRLALVDPPGGAARARAEDG